MGLQRPAGATPGDRSSGPVGGGDAAALCPTLWEYLSGESWDDGSPRQTSTLLVFVEEGLCKVCINDRALARKAWMTGKTPDLAFMSLDAALASGNIEWRPDKQPGAGKRR